MKYAILIIIYNRENKVIINEQHTSCSQRAG